MILSPSGSILPSMFSKYTASTAVGGPCSVGSFAELRWKRSSCQHQTQGRGFTDSQKCDRLGLMRDEDTIRGVFELLKPNLSEQGRRLYAAAQVIALGNRSLAAVSRATGIARSTIGRGLRDIDQINNISSGRIRRPR